MNQISYYNLKEKYYSIFIFIASEPYATPIPSDTLNVKKESPYKKTIVVENCNSYCGYLPTKECFSEKSNMYEISLCYHSCHVPEAGDMITDKALELAKRINK